MADTAGVNGQRESFRVVGKPNLPGRLSYALATGMAKFGADYVFDGMLEAKFLRSPYANAVVRKVDVAAALAIPGVVDVLTWEDEDLKNFGARPGPGGTGAAYVDNVADMEDDEVAVIVVAESAELCDEALKALDPQWEVLPHIVDIQEGRKPDAPVIRSNPKGKGNVTVVSASQGDVEAGFREADHVIEYDFYMPAFCGHMPNPPASVSTWFNDPYHDPERPSLHIEGAVWTASGGKDSVGRMYGLPPEKVKQEGLFQGGRYCDWGLRKSQQITPLLARRVGRPVRMTLLRREMYDFNMNERFMHVKVGFQSNGRITAIDDFSISDAGVPPVSTLGTSGDQGTAPIRPAARTSARSWKWSTATAAGCTPAASTAPSTGTRSPWPSNDRRKLGKDPIDVATLNCTGPTGAGRPRPRAQLPGVRRGGKKMMDWKWHRAGNGRFRWGGCTARFSISDVSRHSFFGIQLETGAA